jgi:hypothetical protein
MIPANPSRMQKAGLKGVLMGVVALCALSATSVPAVADDSYMLKRVYKSGDIDKYKTVINVDGQGGAIKVDITIVTTETVKDVKPDGTVTLETVINSGTLSFGGNEMPLPGVNTAPVLTTFDKNGKPVEKPGAPKRDKSAAMMMSATRPSFAPDKAMKIGDEWKFDNSKTADAKTDPIARGTVTVMGLEKAGADVAVDTVKVKIVTDTTVPGDTPVKAHMDGNALIEPGTGKTLMATGTVTGLSLPQLGEANMKFTRVRVKPEDKKKG